MEDLIDWRADYRHQYLSPRQGNNSDDCDSTIMLMLLENFYIIVAQILNSREYRLC